MPFLRQENIPLEHYLEYSKLVVTVDMRDKDAPHVEDGLVD